MAKRCPHKEIGLNVTESGWVEIKCQICGREFTFAPHTPKPLWVSEKLAAMYHEGTQPRTQSTK